MKVNVHMHFQGNAAEAFAFYEKVFGSKPQIKMTYAEAPQAAFWSWFFVRWGTSEAPGPLMVRGSVRLR